MNLMILGILTILYPLMYLQMLQDMRLFAIKKLKITEETLTSITNIHPQWKNLVSAVDHRVDRALAILRPQAIADHRALLSSFGWPPPLSALTSSHSDARIVNPLQSMHADHKLRYSENFLALCNLQELQRKRKSRQLVGHDREIALRQPLWAIEELVNPQNLFLHLCIRSQGIMLTLWMKCYSHWLMKLR
jgi:RAD50-interacting protein 1